MNDEYTSDAEYPIIDVTMVVGQREYRYAVDHAFPKGPEFNGTRGTIVAINKRDHDCGAEFHILVTNDGIDRHWVTMSSHEYHAKHNIKEHAV